LLVMLRMNAVVTYRVADARTAVSTVDDVRQALYREAQLALRAVVGARELDTFLMEKDGVASELLCCHYRTALGCRPGSRARLLVRVPRPWAWS
jgi:hypothetical protein